MARIAKRRSRRQQKPAETGGGGRSYWKGYLKLSLVTCPVAMTPAITESERVRFRTLNRATGNPVASRYVDGRSGEPVEDDDLVMGYPVAEDELVLLEDDELDSVALDSTRTIDIRTFVPRDGIDLFWRDRPHYLMPDDEVGAEAFAVIREGMERTGTVGLSQLVLYRRERQVMIEPRDRGMLLWTLREADQMRDQEDRVERAKEARAPAEMVRMAADVIGRRTREWSPDLVGDRVQERLAEIIAARTKGAKPAKRTAPEPPESGKVINIMDALRRSLAAEGQRGRKR
ncbi:MAG: Ku protein [Alphaproteobacteria bacterium]